MHWKVAASNSPLGCAVLNLEDGFLMTDIEGNVTFYTYKDFPRNGRPANDKEIKMKYGWISLKEPLPSSTLR